MMRRLTLFVVLLAALVVGARFARGSDVIEVSPGQSVTAAVAGAPSGATVRLLPGDHAPFEVSRRVTVQAAPGAIVRGPVSISADGARLQALEVKGGESGITINGVDGVTLDGVTILGSRLHGVEVSDGSATIRGCVIGGLTSQYAQGVEVRNSNGHPTTTVDGCSVSSGQEGLVSHVSTVAFRDNAVSDTTLRAISVTEMSRGVVEGNQVHDAVGIGLYCGDMSQCDMRDNVVRGVTPDPSGVTSRAGYGAVAHYYSTMRLAGNSFSATSEGPVGVFLDSRLTDRFPIGHWPPGWTGSIPALWVSAAALLGLLAVRSGVRLWLSRRPPRAPARSVASPTAVNVLVAGFLVQTFHMLEHGVQVFQVFVAEAETRSGVLGASIDNEWLHFAFNAAVIVFLVWAWRLVRPGGVLGARVGLSAASFLGAAVLIQAYHVAEHTAKVVQHVGLGVKTAPGLFGGAAGLVWFHYGINLAVYVGMAIPLVTLGLRSLRERLAAEGFTLLPRDSAEGAG